ncbi:MAG: hypothetical protein KDK27_06260, partial [Leptospiraceae bacterium]|nr:hypothetical protein [Leptospiraceae bacterium]
FPATLNKTKQSGYLKPECIEPDYESYQSLNCTAYLSDCAAVEAKNEMHGGMQSHLSRTGSSTQTDGYNTLRENEETGKKCGPSGT